MVTDKMRGPYRRRTQTYIGQLEPAVVSNRREHQSGCGEGEGVRSAHGPGGTRQRGGAYKLYGGAARRGRGTQGYEVRTFSGRRPVMRS